jgi:hypothetical protein
MPFFAFIVLKGLFTTFDQATMDFAMPPSTEDFDNTYVYFSIVACLVIMLNFFIHAHGFCRKLELDLEASRDDGWDVHILENESLSKHDEMEYDVLPIYDGSMYGSVSIVVVERGSEYDDYIVVAARLAAVA